MASKSVLPFFNDGLSLRGDLFAYLTGVIRQVADIANKVLN